MVCKAWEAVGAKTAHFSSPDMLKRLLMRLAILGVRSLARNPAVRAEIERRTVQVSRTVGDHLRPRVERAWREVRPKIETARVRVNRFVEERRWRR